MTTDDHLTAFERLTPEQQIAEKLRRLKTAVKSEKLTRADRRKWITTILQSALYSDADITRTLTVVESTGSAQSCDWLYGHDIDSVEVLLPISPKYRLWTYGDVDRYAATAEMAVAG